MSSHSIYLNVLRKDIHLIHVHTPLLSGARSIIREIKASQYNWLSLSQTLITLTIAYYRFRS